MQTVIIEATNGPQNWGKFLIGRFDSEWRTESKVMADSGLPGRSILSTRGWSKEHIIVFDLETNEGAAFRSIRFGCARCSSLSWAGCTRRTYPILLNCLSLSTCRTRHLKCTAIGDPGRRDQKMDQKIDNWVPLGDVKITLEQLRRLENDGKLTLTLTPGVVSFVLTLLLERPRGVSSKPSVYFFGCLQGIDEHHNEAGHYMYSSDGTDLNRLQNPWGTHPDGTLCPEGGQVQGLALIHYKDGWTAMGFWDRTGDDRGNSNSNFLVKGSYTFEEMCELVKEAYPKLWKRIGGVKLKGA